MPEQTTTGTETPQTTPDAAANNTGAGAETGAGTQTATTEATQSQTDITKTPEFKAALTKAMESKIPQLKKQIAKEISGEKDGLPDVEELNKQVETHRTRAQTAEARLEIRDFISDPANKTGARMENLRAIEKLALAEIEFDNDGKVTNLADAIKQVKKDAPTLFNQSVTVNANANGTVEATDFNQMIRNAAGYR